jgi:hypothetical protein
MKRLSDIWHEDDLKRYTATIIAPQWFLAFPSSYIRGPMWRLGKQEMPVPQAL